MGGLSIVSSSTGDLEHDFLVDNRCEDRRDERGLDETLGGEDS